jgi:hypothetical protein
VLSDGRGERYHDEVENTALRPELRERFHAMRPALGTVESSIEKALKKLYDERMKITGQNGLSDYDEGFTNFLYTFETSTVARRTPPAAGRIHTVAA